AGTGPGHAEPAAGDRPAVAGRRAARLGGTASRAPSPRAAADLSVRTQALLGAAAAAGWKRAVAGDPGGCGYGVRGRCHGGWHDDCDGCRTADPHATGADFGAARRHRRYWRGRSQRSMTLLELMVQRPGEVGMGTVEQLRVPKIVER